MIPICVRNVFPYSLPIILGGLSALNSEKRNTENTKESQRTTEKSRFFPSVVTCLFLHGILSALCEFSPCPLC
jgi:hypothetical protein